MARVAKFIQKAVFQNRKYERAIVPCLEVVPL